jgi:hypothetical protein
MSEPRYYLTKRSNGIYYFGIRTTGKLHWRTTKCRRKSDALRYIKDFSAQQTGQSTPSPKLSAFLTVFLSRTQGVLRQSTAKLYQLHALQFIAVVGDKTLSRHCIRRNERES